VGSSRPKAAAGGSPPHPVRLRHHCPAGGAAEFGVSGLKVAVDDVLAEQEPGGDLAPVLDIVMSAFELGLRELLRAGYEGSMFGFRWKRLSGS
jgi:hypothetical protein